MEKKIGIGECGLLRGLSIDDVQSMKPFCNLCEVITEGNFNPDSLSSFPSLQMGFEMALRSLKQRILLFFSRPHSQKTLFKSQ